MLFFLARFRLGRVVSVCSLWSMFLMVSLLLLTSCSLFKIESRDWPANWPPESYFQAIYDLDRANQTAQSYGDYIVWVKRFYSGWEFYPSGWDGIVEQLLATKEDPALQAWLRQGMLEIGAKISSEWAKDNYHRLINSQHLLNWSDAVRHSVTLGQEVWLFAEINQDIAALMNASVTAQSIEQKRYFDSGREVDESNNEFDF